MNQFTENLPNQVTLEMVSLPAGEFLMGSDESDYEKPQHQVKVNSFAIGKYPVTQAQYEAVMGTNPSYFKNNPQNPVEDVSWNDAKAFCQKLSRITGKTYRLPTEAEWEYACRAGTTTRYYFGDDANQLGDYAWYYENSNRTTHRVNRTTHRVGQKKPNGWGIYDMSGNVWEWCEDDWHNSYAGAPDDGTAWLDNDNRSQSLKCLRGGSWLFNPDFCRSASRSGPYPDDHDYDIGFRVVCDNQMFFYNPFNFPLLTSSVKEFAVKLENMLVKLEHHLAISEDGLYCRIFFHQPYTGVYPGVYDTQKVYQMLNDFTEHKNYLWSFLQDCKA
jgi:formylglycine-generating enzyme required for sulfatase activity